MPEKQCRRYAWLLLLIAAAFPLLVIVASQFSYTVKSENGIVCACAATALYVLCAVLYLRSRKRASELTDSCENESNSGDGVKTDPLQSIPLCAALFVNPISSFFFNALTKNIFGMLLMALWLFLTAGIVLVCVKPVWLEVACLLLAILIAPVALLGVAFADLGETTVLASEISPDGQYCAEVLEHDEGALGGSTRLNVYRVPGSFSLGSFTFYKDQYQMYSGDWGTFEHLQWQDETHVVYNGSVYALPQS